MFRESNLHNIINRRIGSKLYQVIFSVNYKHVFKIYIIA